MGTALHSFIDIFNTTFEVDQKTIPLKKIEIPIIQRDYAQGRLDEEVSRIRMRFLDSLHQAVTDKPITLDFVYGDIDAHGVMTPLDGQQRLTALFLLHWYAAKRERIDESEYRFLENFTYETRASAREFRKRLIAYTPSFASRISEEIVEQAWFPLSWKKDPTVSSMLVMLDAIHDVFGQTAGLWEKLKNKAITFYFLPIKDMGMTDELYIKMNSRGKPLTPFEHFKAELERELRKIDETMAKRIIAKIDLDWTDMLWRYRGDDNVIDDEFLRYFKYVCDILCYKDGGTTQGRRYDEFDLLKEYFSVGSQHVKDNLLLLEAYFDCWCSFPDAGSPESFFEKHISYEHQVGKVKIEKRYRIDLFKDCLRAHAELSGNGNRLFPLNRMALLYAVIAYLLQRETISEGDFSRRLRIVNNLLQNSEFEVRDSEGRTSINRMPAILRQVDVIMQTGSIDNAMEPNLNQNQLEEEQRKIIWVEYNPEQAEALFALEDHDLLQGQISIIGLDQPELFPRFASLFACDWDLVDCALMTIGNYAQQEKNGWRYQLGSGSKKNGMAWRNLFHMSGNGGFDRTRDVLCQLLSHSETFTDEALREIVDAYLSECEAKQRFEWRYYYIKYRLFRPGSYGKYYWSRFASKPYEFSVMRTESKLSENTYQPFLMAVDSKRLSKDDLGQLIRDGENDIVCENEGYVIRNRETKEIVARVMIAQDEQGIDMEDRIVKMKE